METEINIKFKATASNTFGVINKEKFASDFNALQPDQQRMIAQIMGNQKALKGLAQNWKMLQGMFK